MLISTGDDDHYPDTGTYWRKCSIPYLGNERGRRGVLIEVCRVKWPMFEDISPANFVQVWWDLLAPMRTSIKVFLSRDKPRGQAFYRHSRQIGMRGVATFVCVFVTRALLIL